ncbi:type II toxin-antitoxin system antitoxin SocA domain-containing protein [Clostridium arbusti]|uniref:type II toxin-antitoxin system antitoxin SocA domain-containing protein n=1 Tax=Clostridium arbusti TaxID=1137848 RepID=UPI0002892E88|nr:type II toxin-antitoxin system antitoxin SocA domain-containing protein [Clostridium arbusti]
MNNKKKEFKEINKVYCEFCDEDIEYDTVIEEETININGIEVTFNKIKDYCVDCHNEVYVEEDNITNVKNANIEYRKKLGLIQVDEINSLLSKYNIGKTTLASLLGWGEITIVRYMEGSTPSKDYSDTLKSLDDPRTMKSLLEKNKEKVTDIAYKKCKKALNQYLDETSIDNCGDTVLENTVSYFLSKDYEVTPLALQKLLYYAQGFYYALRGDYLFREDCEAWVHGPVYTEIYSRYKSFGYDPIKNECIYNLSEEKVSLLDGILKAFGCYNGKILEKFTHSEMPWNKARVGKKDDEPSNEIISKKAIAEYFTNVVEKYNISNVYDIDIYSSTLKDKVL